MAIHYIRAWSGEVRDESPVCGADKNAPDVWGNRTAYPKYVTCDGCVLWLQEREAATAIEEAVSESTKRGAA